jgi:tight adherence protein B
MPWGSTTRTADRQRLGPHQRPHRAPPAPRTDQQEVEGADFGANLARELARADLKLKPSEYLAIWFGAILGLPAFAFLLGQTRHAGAQQPRRVDGRRGHRLLAAALLAEASEEHSGSRSSTPASPTPSRSSRTRAAPAPRSCRPSSSWCVSRTRRSPPEFGRVIREVNLGLPFEEALENMVRRVKSDDLELMATAISVQHQVGGNLAEILDSIAFTIRERVRIIGEIKTLTAQQRMSGYVVGFLPMGLAGVLMVIAPGFMDPMFQKPPEVLGLPQACSSSRSVAS